MKEKTFPQWPRGLRRTLAAEYVGISLSLWDRMVGPSQRQHCWIGTVTVRRRVARPGLHPEADRMVTDPTYRYLADEQPCAASVSICFGEGNRVTFAASRSLPVFAQLRTCRRAAITDAMCQLRTSMLRNEGQHRLIVSGRIFRWNGV
jgi:hypothetical protein